MKINYTNSIRTAVFLLVTLLAACGGGGSSSTSLDSGASSIGNGSGSGSASGVAATADTIPPTIKATNIANNATGVAVNMVLTATFSEAMNASSVNATSFTLSNGATNVTGAIGYDGTTATFTPAAGLAYSTTYTATITVDAKDVAGNSLDANYTWTFATGTAPDNTAPTVVVTNPANNATGISANAVISATFSEAMTPSTLTSSTFTLNNGVTGTVSYSGTTATFIPGSPLAYATKYTATLGTGVKDAAGNALSSNYTWSFTTAAATNPVVTAPTVTSTSPANNATGVSVNAPITATFDQKMNPSSFDAKTFSLDNGVKGVVTYQGFTATFTPSNPLAFSKTYTATLLGNKIAGADASLAADYTWTFTTVIPPINDTGITNDQCFAKGGSIVKCDSTDALDLSPAQDGMVGRDANPATKLNNDDGKLGFSFTDVTVGSDHCVLDNVTGLMWEVKTTDGGLRDWSRIYTNYDSTTSAQTYGYSGYVNPTQANIDAATNSIGFVNAVNATKLCGFNDWRLPTADELQSIVDYSVAGPGPAIDANWFPNTQGNFYWSATDLGSVCAWPVDFWDGAIVTGSTLEPICGRDSPSYVRLVRAGQLQATPRYTVSADGQEVTDNLTKLIWRRCAEGQKWDGTTCTGSALVSTLEQALLQAAGQASYGIAWRLPNIKELTSIADKSLNYPAINATAFPATPPFGFWSSSPVAGTGQAWCVYFGAGSVEFGFACSGYSRFVRDAP